jgi:hypothetical protein
MWEDSMTMEVCEMGLVGMHWADLIEDRVK